jgi:hypothetical protein
MMSHLEGPIVDSFYDICLASWHNELKPPLPSHNTPAANGGFPSFEQESHAKMFHENGVIKDTVPSSTSEPNGLQPNGAGDLGKTLAEVTEDGNSIDLPEHAGKDPHYDPDIAAEVLRAQSVLSPRGSETRMQAVTRHLSTIPSSIYFFSNRYKIPQFNPRRLAALQNANQAKK